MTVWFKEKGVRALLGREGWLYLCGDSNDVVSQITGLQPVKATTIDKYKEVFSLRSQYFSEKNLPYFFFVAPTKEVVYPEFLPVGYDININEFPVNKIVSSLPDVAFPIVFIKDDLLSSKDNYGDLYYKTDTHWNYSGGYVAYLSIYQELSKKLHLTPCINFNDLVFDIDPSYQGDLANKPKAVYFSDRAPKIFDINVDEGSDYSEDALRIRGNAPYTNCIVDDYLKVSDTRETIVHEMSDKTLPKAVVFRDSFALSVMPFLSRHFSRIVYIWKPDPDYDVIEKEDPDVVININLDRFMRIPPER